MLHTPPTHTVAIGPFTVTCYAARAQTTLMAHARILPLTKREASLLSVLAEHPDEWVSRVEIYEKAWSPPRPDPDIIKVTVWSLRRKLGCGLGEPPPSGTHYLIGDYRGHYGLFSEPRPMADRRLGARDLSVGKKLNELYYAPDNA